MGDQETLRTKILLLLVDKALLAAALAVLAFYLGLKADRSKTVGEYQKGLFESRVDSYVHVLSKARQVEDSFLLSYCAAKSCPEKDLRLYGQLASIESRLATIKSRIGMAKSGFASSSYGSYDDDLEALLGGIRGQAKSVQELGDVRRETSLFLSESTTKDTDEFIAVVVGAIGSEVVAAETCGKAIAKVADAERSEGHDPNHWANVRDACDRSADGAVQRNVSSAYEKLAVTVRQDLHLWGINLDR